MKKKILALMAVSMLFGLSGCWNYTETENFTIVSGVAIDYIEDEFVITAEIIDMGKSGKGTSEYETKIIQGNGSNVSQAAASMGRMVGKKLYFGHAEVYVLSKTVAERGIDDVIDWFLHENYARITSLVVVADTEKASDLYNIEVLTGTSVSYSLADMIVNFGGGKENSVSRVYTIVNRFRSKGMALQMPIIGGGELNGKLILEIKGTAVFLDDRLAESYDNRETKSIVMIINGGSRGEYEVLTEDGFTVSLRCLNNSLSLTAGMDGSVPRTVMRFKVELLVNGLQNPELPLNTDNIEQINRLAEAKIKEELCGVLEKDLRGAGADIAGIGNRIRENHPEEWKSVEEDWTSIYRELQYEVEVTAEIKISGQASYFREAGTWK